ncbi:MAG: hypothetical protein H6711_33450 [Myxococcales bacterium]|nr:hypothetical protein [Myxococcales bacterium]
MEIQSAIKALPKAVVVPKDRVTIGGAATPEAEVVPRFFGYLLEIRAEAQNFAVAIERLKGAASLADPAAREAELGLALAEGTAIERRNRDRITTLLTRLHQWMEEHALLHQWCADQVIHIENAWERVEFHLDRLREVIEAGRSSDARVLSSALEIARQLERMVFLIGYLTIPQRVNEHLRQLRIGQALDFHRDFADELADPAERVQLLTTMRAHPAQIEGVVDVERGLIYKTASTRGRQVFSVVLQLLTWVGLGAGLAGLAYLEIWDELGDPATLLERYLFVTLGSVLHLALGTLKQRRAGKAGDVHALDDLLLFIHVREVAIAWTIFATAVGTVGLCFVSSDASPEAALIVGYSLDSFIDLFLMRFEARTTGVAKAVTRKG